MVCQRPRNEGKHYVRGPLGAKCTAPGCNAPVFEHCELNGTTIATRCLKGGHKLILR